MKNIDAKPARAMMKIYLTDNVFSRLVIPAKVVDPVRAGIQA